MLIRQDLEFWRQLVGYLDQVDFRSLPEVQSMQKCLQTLDDKLLELDFAAARDYLEIRYIKPIIELSQKQPGSEDEIKQINE